MAGPLVKPVRTGWSSVLACGTAWALVFLGATGLAITFAPFHPSVEWGVIVHTVVGLLTLAPVAWYLWVHWKDYRSYRFSHVVLLGYVATAALLVCLVSGVVVTAQGLGAPRMSPVWRQVHLLSTFVTLGTALPHMALVLLRLRAATGLAAALRFVGVASGLTVLGLACTGLLPLAYPGQRYVNEFPADYEYVYGEDRPFAPSLARTATGGAFDARSLAGSETCGTPGCHAQIVEEWKPSAHRYAAMDPAFQKIQTIMAEQNGAESTRYCGGCHDPISLFSGTKNIVVENLTGPPRLPGGRLVPGLPRDPRDGHQGQRQLHRDPARGVPVAVGREWLAPSGARFPDPHLSRRARPAEQAHVQGARVLRGLPQAVHRPGGQSGRVGAAAEPVRQLGGQSLEPQGRPEQDRRVPRVPHAARRLDRSRGGRLRRLQPQATTTGSTAATASSRRTR